MTSLPSLDSRRIPAGCVAAALPVLTYLEYAPVRFSPRLAGRARRVVELGPEVIK